MITVLFYNSVLLFSTFFVYISERGKGSLERNFFLLLAYLLMFVPSAIRYGIGADFFSYESIYNNIEYYKHIEPGYYFLNWLLSQLGAGSQWIFVLTSFIFTQAIFKSYPKNKYTWVLHFAAFSMLWFISFNQIRQAITIAFGLLALSKFFEGKTRAFYIYCFLGATIHITGLILPAIGFIASRPLNQNLKYILLPNIFIGVIVFTFLSIDPVIYLIQSLLPILGFSQYLSYFNSIFFREIVDGTGLGVLAKVLFSIYIILNTKDILKVNENYWILILLNVLYAVSAILAANIVIFGRLQYVFIMAPIVSLYVIFNIKNSKYKQIHKLVIAIFTIFLFFSYILASFGRSNSVFDPRLNPYTTILENNSRIL